jgi:amino-acid N-acetyltransferase
LTTGLAVLHGLTTSAGIDDVPTSPLTITQDGVHFGNAPRVGTSLVLLRRGRPDDVRAIMPILNAYVREGLLLPRTEEQVFRNIREFTVAVDAEGIVGCGALKLYSRELAEVGALAVHERAQGHGVGSAIVDALVDEARDLGIKRVIALTMSEHFFNRLGFRTVPISQFPQKVAADCSVCSKRASCAEIAVVKDL